MFAILRFWGVAALATSAWAQVGGIEGVVKYSNGALAKGAVVRVEPEDTKGVSKSCKTDKNAHYVCNGLPVAVYKLRVFMSGRLVDSVDHVRTHPGTNTPINFAIKIPTARLRDPVTQREEATP
jgi:Carboxypeptidase regulatory-like domain